LTRANVTQQRLQSRALQCSARETPVGIMGLDQLPALMGLALDVRFRRFALGIERVEVLFEPVLGGFASVDGTAQDLAPVSHHPAPASCRSHRACQKNAVHSSWCR